MKFTPVVVALLWAVAANCAPVGVKDSSDCKSYPCLIFADEFDNFDLQTWEHEITAGGGGNWEFEYYHNNRSNSYVKDGKLFIKPTLGEERFGTDWPYWGSLNLWGTLPADKCTGNLWWGCERQASGSVIVNPIQSARIRTVSSFAYRYGRLEVEVKLPKGDWIWPAIWLLPKYQKYGQWPMSGEIDLVEARCNADLFDASGKQVGIKSAGVTQHFGPFQGVNGWQTAHADLTLTTGRSFADDFHRFRLDWDETGLKYFIDDQLLLDTKTGPGYFKRGGWDKQFGNETNVWGLNGNLDAPFDQEFYIVMNAAVGGVGGYFGDSFKHPSYPKPWRDTSPLAMREFYDSRNQWLPTWPNNDDRAMQINYVRVWKLKPDCWLTKPAMCR